MNTAEITLLPKQVEGWELLYENPEITELGYGGAAGGGKTRFGWYLAITVCETYAGARGIVGRKELKTLKTTTLAELWAIFLELGYKKDVDYTYDNNLNILKFLSTGSEIMMLDTAYSPQDPEYTRFGSLPVTFSWIDESNETPEKAKAILKTRVGRANILKKVVVDKEGKKSLSAETFVVKGMWLETFNPNKGHVHRDYYKPWKTGTMPPYRAFVRALPGDNKYLSKQYMDNLERADKTTRERLLNGNFEYDSDPMKMFIYDSITDLPVNNLLPSTKALPSGEVVLDTVKDSQKFMIADIARFGGDKIVLGVFKGWNLYSLGVYTYQGVDETIKLMKQEAQEEGVPFPHILADEDGVGGGVVDGMRGIKGFHGNGSPTMVWDFIKGKMISANFRNIRSQSIFALADMVNERKMSVKITKFKTNIVGYTVEDALSNLFEELDAIKKVDNSDESKQAVISKDEMKEMLGRSPDFADVMMMRMYFELKDEPEEANPYQYYPQNNAPKINKAR